MNKKQIVNIVRRVLPILVVSLTVYFFAKALNRNWQQIQDISLRPNMLSVVGMLLLIASVIVSGQLWGKILNKIVPDNHIGILDSIRIHTASWLLKYIPGQAGSYLNKISWGTKKGYTKKALTNSFIYENALLLFASVILAGPVILIALSDRIGGDLGLFAPLLFVVPLILILNKNIFYKVVNALFMRLKKQSISSDLFLSTKQIASLQLEFLIPRILNGAGFVFIAASILNVEPYMYIPLAAIYIIAGIIGVLAIFVPSGLGVREAVIVLLASAYFTPAEAVIISVAARFYATIADLGLLGIYLVLNKGKITQQ